MRYEIEELKFDSVSLVLMKEGEAIAIRHNEAKVLALLLENADKVLSKEDILSQVWQDKVVSEQAIFQNISSLRSLFGRNAIKTFPKRGYQWQFKVNEVSDVPSSANIVREAQLEKSTLSVKARQAAYWPYILLVSIFAMIISFIYWSNNSQKEIITPEINLGAVDLCLNFVRKR